MDIVTLLKELVNGLIKAEEDFYQDPVDLHKLEVTTKATTDAVAAKFISSVLSSMNEQIYKSSIREEHYIAQRTDSRTLISSVGDLVFDCTYYKRKNKEGYVYLLEEMLKLGKHERFTEKAEEMILAEALKTSYAEAARVLPSKQKITKTTVMNKVHQIASDMPLEEADEKKEIDYLFIEADEDHVAEQHGDSTRPEENTSFISKLVYIHEGRQDAKGYKDRKELKNTFYLSGVYPGSEGTEAIWKEAQDYIEKNYDTEKLKRVFISGDGAPWIKGGTNHIDKALFCADKFHLMKYINIAAAQMLDDKEEAKNELWHILYSKKPKAKARFEEYTERMMKSANHPERIEELRTFVISNWAAIRRTLRNKLVGGCSAESHVSHVLSDRLSSRPMGWSQTGADRMSKLRCYDRNYSREKIIYLVRYSREKQRGLRTGTDDEVIKKISVREVTAEHYYQARSYIDRLQASIPGLTAKKSASIRTQLNML